MLRIFYILTVIVLIISFNSCSNEIINGTKDKEQTAHVVCPIDISSSYGAYLAGRVAHLRKNFNTAADNYVKVLSKDPDNKDLLSKIYIILASKQRVPEAAKFAQISLDKGDKNNLTHIIIAVDKMSSGKFQEANQTIKKLDGPVYKEFIVPLMSAWAYAGEGNKEQALKTISILQKEPSFNGLYHFHKGMIHDFFGNKQEALENYEKLISGDAPDLSFRSLQIMTNLYVRTNQKDKAIALMKRFSNDRVHQDMLQKLNHNITKSIPETTPPIVNNPNIGLSEALFNIAATLKQGEAGTDLAHVFISLSIFANPKYDLGRILLADILESRGIYTIANEVYDEISPSSEAYFSAQIKKSTNLVLLQDYKAAELLLKSLHLDYPNNPQLMLDLADVLRVQGSYEEAIKYYQKAIHVIPRVENDHWILFYALAVAYDANKQWKDAEINFKKALELSNNHFMVQNHLGYSWLQQGKNIDKAFSMIADAYNQAPHDGNIIDSLGWAFYQIGKYDKAVEFLERASEQEPANALIYDHLGDAYWEKGRKNEAVFQWKHALIMKDINGEIDRTKIEEKIKNGLIISTPHPFDEEIINQKIKTIQDN